MPDVLSKEQRSWNMSRIRSRDTQIEMRVRKHLFNKGFRYRKNVASLPGKPDIVLPKYNTVIFVHGCYWHRHENCKYSTTPKTRAEFWNEKFNRNIANDKKHQKALRDMGWHVIILWECQIKHQFDDTMGNCISQLLSDADKDKCHE